MDALRIGVVGGGTAGWLSALILQDAAKRHEFPLRLTVIESSDIPTIGVGEGTTSVFRGLLHSMGFDELEFIRETGATIKYGIRHRDWRNVGVTYDGPIDDPHLLVPDLKHIESSWLNQFCVATGRSVTEPHLFTYFMKHSRAPFKGDSPSSLKLMSPYHHAYHFDQALVGRYLKKKSEGIEHLDAKVADARRDGSSGNITALILEGGKELEVDFVVDCTGFRRAVIGRIMGAKWKSFSDQLPVNRALTFWLPHAPESEILPLTTAWALSSGWMWQIPTQSRLGCGYVFSDQFATLDEARLEVESALKRKIEPRGDIRINSGRLDDSWIGNCLAAGLAQSFFEPLEATSIHGTIVQMFLFANHHLTAIAKGLDGNREAYNRVAAQQVDDFCDFINMHYVSERRDSAFWRHVSQNCLGEATKRRLRQWSRRLPTQTDFAELPWQFPHIGAELYYPVLDGLGLLDRRVAKEELARNPKLRATARMVAMKFKKKFWRESIKALGHRKFLEILRE